MEQKALPEVCHIQYGYPFDSKRFSDKEGFPLIRIRDVVRGHTETFTTESCNDEYIVKKGDILIGMDGMFNVAKWKGNTAYLNQRVCKIEPNSSIVADYLFYYLPCALKKIENKTAFVTVKHLKAKQLNSILIPCPPVKEQKRIAQILDLLFYLICQKKKQLNYLDELVKSRFIEMFGDLINEPKYPGIKLGSLGIMITGGTPSRKHDEYYGGNIPFISTPCLGSNFISEKNVQNYLTEAGVKNSATHKIPPYSLMVGNRVGVGKSSINTCEMCTNQDILSFVHIDTSRFDLLFLKKVIDQYSPYFDEHKRGATIQGVPSKVIKDSMVPDVPLEMQKRYTALVKQSDKSKYGGTIFP